MRTPGLGKKVRWCPSQEYFILLAIGSPIPSTSHETEVGHSSLSYRVYDPLGFEAWLVRTKDSSSNAALDLSMPEYTAGDKRRIEELGPSTSSLSQNSLESNTKKMKAQTPETRLKGLVDRSTKPRAESKYLDPALNYSTAEIQKHVAETVEKLRSMKPQLVRQQILLDRIGEMYIDSNAPVAITYKTSERLFSVELLPGTPADKNPSTAPTSDKTMPLRIIDSGTRIMADVTSIIYKDRIALSTLTSGDNSAASQAAVKSSQMRLELGECFKDQPVMNFHSRAVGLNFANLLRSLVDVMNEGRYRSSAMNYLACILGKSICYEFIPRGTDERIPTAVALYDLIQNFKAEANGHIAPIRHSAHSSQYYSNFLTYHRKFFESLKQASMMIKQMEGDKKGDVTRIVATLAPLKQPSIERRHGQPTGNLTEQATLAPQPLFGDISSDYPALSRESYHTLNQTRLKMERFLKIMNRFNVDGSLILSPKNCPIWILWHRFDLSAPVWLSSHILRKLSEPTVQKMTVSASELMRKIYAKIRASSSDLDDVQARFKYPLAVGYANGHVRLSKILNLDGECSRVVRKLAEHLGRKILRGVSGDIRVFSAGHFIQPQYLDSLIRILEHAMELQAKESVFQTVSYVPRILDFFLEHQGIFARWSCSAEMLEMNKFQGHLECNGDKHFLSLVDYTVKMREWLDHPSRKNPDCRKIGEETDELLRRLWNSAFECHNITREKIGRLFHTMKFSKNKKASYDTLRKQWLLYARDMNLTQPSGMCDEK